MAQVIAVKFDLSGTVVSFDKNELRANPFQFARRVNMPDPPFGMTIVIPEGSAKKIFHLSIKQWYASTIAKIRSLIDWENEMTMYYFYRSQPALTATVILNPEETTQEYDYSYGHQCVISHDLEFLET